MESSRKFDVVIAGAGPAGLATALFLVKRRPSLAGRIVAIEKSRHPRFKICAGGLIPKTMLALEELGLELEVPAIEVMRGTARTEIGEVEMFRMATRCATVIRRDEFDARLARAAKDAGLDDHRSVPGVGNRSIQRLGAGADRARHLRDADAGRRRWLRAAACALRCSARRKQNIGRALMIGHSRSIPNARREFIEQRYRFDFRCVSHGINGYAWSFPCLIGGAPHLNVGIYDQRPRDSLKMAASNRGWWPNSPPRFPNFRSTVCGDTRRDGGHFRFDGSTRAIVTLAAASFSPAMRLASIR